MSSATSSVTGDIKNNLSKLLRELKRMNMKIEPNIRGLLLGIPSAFLPILHGALMSYSLPLAQHLSSLGLKMYGRNDLRFVEGFYKVMRDVFQYRPKITRDQFLSIGFAECKIILTIDILKQCQTEHNQLTDKSNKTRQRTKMASSFATVHTVGQSSGIGSVWQEKISDISPKPHLPLSPPASPLHSSFTNECITIIPEPILELTPLSTPIKGSTTSTEYNMFQSPDREINININELQLFDDIEIVTVQSEDIRDIGTSPKQDIGTSPKQDMTSLEQVVVYPVYRGVLISESIVIERVEEMMMLMNQLMNRMILAETQLKILQDRGVVIEKGSGIDTGTQTDQTIVCDAAIGTVSDTVGTTVPRRNILATPIKDPPNTTPNNHHIDHTHFSTPNKAPPTLSFETPIINYNNSYSSPVISENTRKILSNLRTRAKQTKELLDKANHVTTSSLDPVY